MFQLARDKWNKVSQKYQFAAGHIQWNIPFRRSLTKEEEVEYLAFIDLLQTTYLDLSTSDQITWNGSANGFFAKLSTS